MDVTRFRFKTKLLAGTMAFAVCALLGTGASQAQVTAPETGEKWAIGFIKTISWNKATVGSAVKIEFGKPVGCGYTWSSIIDSTGNTGCYQWTVTEPAQASCKIKVSSATPAASFESGVFDIVKPVTAPEAGESWAIQSTHSIQWNKDVYAGNVKIELGRPGGSCGYAWSILVATTGNDGSESWTVTGPEQQNCQIRVSSVANPATTQGLSGLFNITPALCTTYYKDNDGDTYGVTGDTQCLSAPAHPYDATRGGDCNDASASAYPGAAEIQCNGVDEDCNGSDACVQCASGTCCIDTDGGKNSSVAGSIDGVYNGSALKAADYCSGNSVIEYYCTTDGSFNPVIGAATITCSGGCSNGRCN